MAKIYKSKTKYPLTRLDAYLTKEITSTGFKHIFNITPNLLKYKFIRTEDEQIIYNISISLDQVKSNSNYSSQCFIVPSSESINHFTGSEEEIILTTHDLVFPLNKTIVNKSVVLTNLEEYPESYFSMFKIFVPSSDGDFTTFNYLISDFDIINVETNSPNTVETTLKSWKEFFSTITCTTEQSIINPGDTITVNVESSEASLDMVYIEPIVGVVDRTRVKLTNGLGSFNILTTTLQSGDIAEVKINFKSYTGAARFTKTIS